MKKLLFASALGALALAPAALLAQSAPSVSEIVVTKLMDSTSPLLFKNEPNATLKFVRADGSKLGPIEVFVSPALAKQLRTGASGTGKTMAAEVLARQIKGIKLTARKAGGTQWLALKGRSASGDHFKKAVITMRKGGGEQTYLEIKLENTLVSNYSLGGHGAASGGDRPTESLSINFTKIEFKYVPYDDQHKS